MTILLETIRPPESGLLDINIKLTASIKIPPLEARRQVSIFVTHNIADLLHGDIPNLVWREEGVYWRVPVILSSPSKGRIGLIGTIDVDVETGKLLITNTNIGKIEQEAQRLAEYVSL
ncbi:hypothetical protein QUF58_09270 [Anaerolineales bacterium HSG24]|nr:hypothetical protein [Anaerolineales bacterium HSG24]